MKKGGAALAGPIWNAVMTQALKNLPVEYFNKPDPIDNTIPPILRGFWQGGETFTVDSASNSLATEYTPEETKKEISVTNVHTILYWLDKSNPLQINSGLQNDSQYRNWEYGVQKWWNNNKYKYNVITQQNIPTNHDTIHTNDTKPNIELSGIENRNYNKDETITLSIQPTSLYQIKKVDIFINNTYLTSLKTSPFIATFTPGNINDISQNNTIKVIAVDGVGNIGEKSIPLYINNI